jgi:hypothetical protein
MMFIWDNDHFIKNKTKIIYKNKFKIKQILNNKIKKNKKKRECNKRKIKKRPSSSLFMLIVKEVTLILILDVLSNCVWSDILVSILAFSFPFSPMNLKP